MIRLCNLQQPPEVFDDVEDVLHSQRYVKGPKVDEFEKAWAERCGKKHCIAVGSGAQALELAVQAIWGSAQSESQQELISYTSGTFKAVGNAISRIGHDALPTLKPYPSIYAHHLHDHKIDYIPDLEDCSHCHGYKPKAKTAIFSFFPTKILGACGEAGAIVTDDDLIADKTRYLRNHGIPYGTNARMDEIQAAVLLVKLAYLDGYIKRRKEIVDMYDQGLDRKTAGRYHYAYCISGSKEKADRLKAMGIETNFYYEEKYMALPLHPFLTDSEVKEVIRCVLQL